MSEPKEYNLNLRGENETRTVCPDCGGRGYTLSDPDGKQLVCRACEMPKIVKAMKEKLEAAFSQDDPDEASPEDRKVRPQIIGGIAAELMLEEAAKEK
ncbi:MAG: hypothetical protein NTV82_01145 [Candidatus Aminicenantes bacterium]|nr:hypothetical protein [Candidatus Aminicenantes bacterium]